MNFFLWDPSYTRSHSSLLLNKSTFALLKKKKKKEVERREEKEKIKDELVSRQEKTRREIRKLMRERIKLV